MESEMIERVAARLKAAMQDSGSVKLQANGPKGEAALEQFFETLAGGAIEALTLQDLLNEIDRRFKAGTSEPGEIG
jgi:hypothetical protein